MKKFETPAGSPERAGIGRYAPGSTTNIGSAALSMPRIIPVERYSREMIATRLAPVSREMISCFIAERALGLPKS